MPVSTLQYGRLLKQMRKMVFVKTAVLGNTTPHNLVIRDQCFGGKCCLNPQGKRVGQECKKFYEYRERRGLEV